MPKESDYAVLQWQDAQVTPQLESEPGTELFRSSGLPWLGSVATVRSWIRLAHRLNPH
jgi:hypothetical protein